MTWLSGWLERQDGLLGRAAADRPIEEHDFGRTRAVGAQLAALILVLRVPQHERGWGSVAAVGDVGSCASSASARTGGCGERVAGVGGVDSCASSASA